MGVDFEDVEAFTFAMLVVPDGRIVCQRPAHPGFVKKWQATAYRKVRVCGSLDVAVYTAHWVLGSLLNVSRQDVQCTHMASHYVVEMNKKLEIVLCKMGSGSQMKIGKNIEIKLKTFDQILSGIEKDKGAYAPHTIHAANIIGTLSSWGKAT